MLTPTSLLSSLPQPITGGTKDYKILMDNYQEAIEEITRWMGAGMAKFIQKEVETVDDYDEYCHYVAGLVGLGLSKLFYVAGLEDLAFDSLSNSMGLFLQMMLLPLTGQKANILRDYLEDINEIPKSRMFWPREIWSKYANKLEYFKYEENFEKSVQCLNDMVTNALIHVKVSLRFWHEDMHGGIKLHVRNGSSMPSRPLLTTSNFDDFGTSDQAYMV
ncbi:squalene synthase-like protein [Carex littledalei]|uniref:Squalene synthase-like protein n=1 Tax=Carex littledalei TaxID=544730 RepID=A0A833QPR5_9POAL|nr:squalene synthase-like protein [Carex littledalei]